MIPPLLGPAGFGLPEMLVILAVVLILFGGSRLAGLGKSTGRALREFKEETKGLTGDKDKDAEVDPQIQGHQTTGHQTTGHQSVSGDIVEPTVVDAPRTDLPQSTPETRRDV